MTRKNKQPHLFSVELGQLRRGPLAFERDIPLPWLAEEMEYCEYAAVPEEARFFVAVEPCGNCVRIKGSLQVRVSTECSICGDETVLDIAPNVDVFLMPKTQGDKYREKIELTPEDLEREWFEGDTIVLDGLLRDAVMLELPISVKCGDICPGLTALSKLESGAKTDPRLAPLRNIKLSMEK